MEVSRLTIPSGIAGTDATVEIMRRMIDDGRRTVGIRRLAEQIIRKSGVRSYDYLGELSALLGWVQSSIRYLKDPVEVEYIQTPEQTVKSGVGDCDDLTVLLGSLSESIGHPIKIKVVSRDRNRNYHHVYPVAQVGDQLIGLDATLPYPIGFESPYIVKAKIYPGVSGNMSRPLSTRKTVFDGLGQVVGKRAVVTGGDGATVPITITPDLPVLKKPVPETPTIYQPPPVEPKVVPDQPTVYMKPPINGGTVPTEPVIYPPAPGGDVTRPTNGKTVPTEPVIYPPAPGGDVTRPTNGGGGTIPTTGGGGTVVQIAETPGPLGLPWIVWIGAGVAAIWLLKK